MQKRSMKTDHVKMPCTSDPIAVQPPQSQHTRNTSALSARQSSPTPKILLTPYHSTLSPCGLEAASALESKTLLHAYSLFSLLFFYHSHSSLFPSFDYALGGFDGCFLGPPCPSPDPSSDLGGLQEREQQGLRVTAANSRSCWKLRQI